MKSRNTRHHPPKVLECYKCGGTATNTSEFVKHFHTHHELNTTGPKQPTEPKQSKTPRQSEAPKQRKIPKQSKTPKQRDANLGGHPPIVRENIGEFSISCPRCLRVDGVELMFTDEKELIKHWLSTTVRRT
jgi:uncharacterized C2H2 Zn-finger protein